ncbi:Esterase lipase thioesterase active site [Coemansia sp. RSA 1286]|nr:Esterase lipase thioesterase active site [Coemansia sp. RSA 1286]
MPVTVASYGSWESPLTAEAVAVASSSVGSVVVDPTDPTRVYWLESRPSEGGRYVLLSKLVDDYDDSTLINHLPDTKWNVRTAVHEYGGGAYTAYGKAIVFVNWADQGLYVLENKSSEPRRIGEQEEGVRYASFAVHPSGEYVVCVREDHRVEGEAKNTLVAVRLGGEPGRDTVLFDRSDFVSSPVFGSDGSEIAFITWNHPDMNWDATVLRRARVVASPGDGGAACTLEALAEVAGGEGQQRESIYQPRFDDQGSLHFIGDRSGFWNPYHVDGSGDVVQSLAKPMPAEFAEPEWAFGASTFQPVSGRASSMAVVFHLDDTTRLGILNVETHVIDDLPVPGWTALSNLQLAQARSGEPVLVLVAGSPTESPALYTYFINGVGGQRLLVAGGTKAAGDVGGLDVGSISVPREIAFSTRLPPFDEQSKEVQAYAYYYPPANVRHVGPKDELPPLLVMIHGGPTSATHAVYSAKIQYWTSRGFAVADVNYGGSTGYGREYRERLYPEFGRVDVQDCCAAALHLAGAGLADRRRLCIMGGSAGGFTTLASLAFRPEVFAVGASLYGISDLEVLAKETHKFEAQYPVHLVGPYPEATSVYRERSPLYAVDRLACPAIFLQGLEDRVVPPNQATLMVDALRKKGICVAHVEFAGEQHGFRKAANIVRALEAQLYFFGKVLGFAPSDAIEPVHIFNE